MKKRSSIILSLILVLTLFGCNNGNTNSIDEKTEPVTCKVVVKEIIDEDFAVSPVEGFLDNSSTIIYILNMEHMESSPEPQVGDTLEIKYSGVFTEEEPPSFAGVTNVQVVKEAEPRDLIPMVMVNGELYLDTGHESTMEGRCGVMDGEITTTVDSTEQPTENNQSNFGTGYGYQYGSTEGTIEIYMNEKWWVFAMEKEQSDSEGKREQTP